MITVRRQRRKSSAVPESPLQLGESGGEGGLVGGFEKRSAGHESIGADGATFGGGGEIDAAVDLESEVEAAGRAPVAELGDLREHVTAEALAAEAGLHGHYQHEIDKRQQRLDGGGGSAGIEDDAALAAEGTDASEGADMIVVGLDVNADKIGTGLGEGFNVAMRLAQHQMRVEEKFDPGAAQRGEGFGAE